MGGRIGVLTVVEGSTDEEAAKDVAMHIAAINPKYVSSEQVKRRRNQSRKRSIKTTSIK